MGLTAPPFCGNVETIVTARPDHASGRFGRCVRPGRTTVLSAGRTTPGGTLSTREAGSSGVGDLVFSDTHHETGLFLSLQDVDKPTELWYSIAELRKPHA